MAQRGSAAGGLGAMRFWALFDGVIALLWRQSDTGAITEATTVEMDSDHGCVGTTVRRMPCTNPVVAQGQLCEYHERTSRPKRYSLRLWD